MTPRDLEKLLDEARRERRTESRVADVVTLTIRGGDQ